MPVHARRATVIYIEDNHAHVKLLEQLLVYRPEVEFQAVTRGTSGLSLVRARHPLVVFLDLQLPDMGGEELLRQLRADPETEAIPVVIISADATPDRQERLRAAGAAAYLTKPLDVKEFLSVLDGYLKSNTLSG